ncbi:hypothetical protein HCH_06135 [Hahella chejuensis KCTC 2396]|uniref:Uncharacterized protein n=1 Tax=Hahella chejuensis (strain KCTC 2396) TaxID=349521 RepID=Q2S991_HAHCH|nr:hypothetical protein HCH_06135 [Hahella chejuensis KCTC 2396]
MEFELFRHLRPSVDLLFNTSPEDPAPTFTQCSDLLFRQSGETGECAGRLPGKEVPDGICPGCGKAAYYAGYDSRWIVQFNVAFMSFSY